MLEVEVKFRSPGNDLVIEALKRLGAERLTEESIEDVYYGHPSRDFGSSDEAVRLRRRPDSAELTYKGPRMTSSSAKAREELSMVVSDALSAGRILERLGFSELISVRKRRTTYLMDTLKVDVDEVEGLGQFVELELMTEDVAKAEKLLGSARSELPLGDEVKETYLEMLLNRRS
ncbi:MAG TPA: class IV adenylate cyclase [Thermoplasmata archaeon]|nr:class IV adenylate cyclase [Thermoplasmata archaeon]